MVRRHFAFLHLVWRRRHVFGLILWTLSHNSRLKSQARLESEHATQATVYSRSLNFCVALYSPRVATEGKQSLSTHAAHHTHRRLPKQVCLLQKSSRVAAIAWMHCMCCCVAVFNADVIALGGKNAWRLVCETPPFVTCPNVMHVLNMPCTAACLPPPYASTWHGTETHVRFMVSW